MATSYHNCSTCDHDDAKLKRRRLPCRPILALTCPLCCCCKSCDFCECRALCCCCCHDRICCRSTCCPRIDSDDYPRQAACGWTVYLLCVLLIPTVVITTLFWVLYQEVSVVGQVPCTTTKIWIDLDVCESGTGGEDATYDPCLCAYRRVEYYRPADPPPSGTVYGHNFEEGYCCWWYGSETAECGYNSPQMLSYVLPYLNRTDQCWINYETGTYFQSGLVIGSTTPYEARDQYMIAWIVMMSIFVLMICAICYCCRMGRINDRIDATRSQRHDAHAKGLHTFLFGLKTRLGGKALRAFVTDPLYDHRMMPKLIASFAFPEVKSLADTPMIPNDDSFAIGIKTDSELATLSRKQQPTRPTKLNNIKRRQSK